MIVRGIPRESRSSSGPYANKKARPRLRPGFFICTGPDTTYFRNDNMRRRCASVLRRRLTLRGAQSYGRHSRAAAKVGHRIVRTRSVRTHGRGVDVLKARPRLGRAFLFAQVPTRSTFGT